MIANLDVDLTQSAEEAHKDMVEVQHVHLGQTQANIETKEQRIKEAIAAEKKAEKKAAQLQKLFQIIIQHQQKLK